MTEFITFLQNASASTGQDIEVWWDHQPIDQLDAVVMHRESDGLRILMVEAS